MSIKWIDDSWKSDLETAAHDTRVYFNPRNKIYPGLEDNVTEFELNKPFYNAPGSHRAYMFRSRTNLVAASDLNDFTEWNTSATFHTNTGNVYDQAIRKTVFKWNAGSATNRTFLYDTNNDIGGISTYSNTIWIYATQDITVIPGIYYGGGSVEQSANSYNVSANTWTLVRDTNTYTNDPEGEQWRIEPDGGSFSAASEFRACEPNWLDLNRPLPFSDLTASANKFSYLIEQPSNFSLRIELEPWFTLSSTLFHRIIEWYADSNNYFTVLWDPTGNRFYLEYKNGTNIRRLFCSAFASNALLQQRHVIDISCDLTTGTTAGTAIYLNGTLCGSTWDGAIDSFSTVSQIMNIGSDYLGASNADSEFFNVQLINGYEITQADVTSNWKDVLYERVVWDFNGHDTGYGWCQIKSSDLLSTMTAGAIEDRVSKQPGSNRFSCTLLNQSGQYADDQYVAYAPESQSYNGTSSQKYLQTSNMIKMESWYGNENDLLFVGTSGFINRSAQSQGINTVSLSGQDTYNQLLTHRIKSAKKYKDYKLSDTSDESNSLLHTYIKLNTDKQVINYCSNSGFENATIGNSWSNSGLSSVTRSSTEALCGTYSAALVADGLGDDYIFQDVRFTGDKKLNVGDTYTFSIYLLSTSACGYIIQLSERDSSGNNGSTTLVYSIGGGEGWTKWSVSRTITDADSDRLFCIIYMNDAVTMYADCAMLTFGGNQVEGYFENTDDGTSGVYLADNAAAGTYSTVGIDADDIDVTHPYAVLEQGDVLGNHIEQIGVAGASTYLGLDSNGTFKFRCNYGERGNQYNIETVTNANRIMKGHNTGLLPQQINSLVVQGVDFDVSDKERVVWDGFSSGAFDQGSGQWIAEDVLNGGVFPSTDKQPFYADFMEDLAAPIQSYSMASSLDLKFTNPAKVENYLKSKNPPETYSPTDKKYGPGPSTISRNVKKDPLEGVVIPNIPIVYRLGKYIQLSTDYKIISADDLTVIHRTDDSGESAGTLTQDTFSSTWDTERADSARLKFTNSTGGTRTVYAIALRGKPVVRFVAFMHDSFIDMEDQLISGERLLAVGNNYVCTKTQTDALADYYWKYFSVNKHYYNVSILGSCHWFEAGEQYTLQISTDQEDIDSVVVCSQVSVQRKPNSLGITGIQFREIEESWTKTSNAAARYIASGGTKKKLLSRSNEIIVASQYYTGVADIYCDGTDDQVQIQAAIDVLSESSGGGTIKLVTGVYNIEDTITMESNISLIGAGSGTTLSKNLSGVAITSSNNSDVMISNMNITRNTSDTSVYNFISVDTDTNFSLQNIVFSDTKKGFVDLTDCSYCTITQCKLSGLSSGTACVVEFITSRNCSVSNNKFLFGGVSVKLNECSSCDVSVNTFYYNIWKPILVYTSLQCSVVGNTVKFNNGYCIYIESSDYCVISSNTLDDNGGSSRGGYGVILDQSDYNNINSNNIYYKDVGIYLTVSDSNVCTGNAAINGTYGIYIFNSTSDNNVITGNRATSNLTSNYTDNGTGTTNIGNDFV